MEKEILLVYILFGIMILFVIFIGIRAIIKVRKEKLTKSQIEKNDRKDGFAMFMFLSIMCLIGPIVCIKEAIYEPSFLMISFSIFFVFLFFSVLLEGINFIYKNDKLNFAKKIIFVVTCLSLYLSILSYVLPKKQLVPILIISITGIYSIFKLIKELFFKNIL
jgi:hypothetical protein